MQRDDSTRTGVQGACSRYAGPFPTIPPDASDLASYDTRMHAWLIHGLCPAEYRQEDGVAYGNARFRLLLAEATSANLDLDKWYPLIVAKLEEWPDVVIVHATAAEIAAVELVVGFLALQMTQGMLL